MFWSLGRTVLELYLRMGTLGLHDVFNAGFAILMLEELLLRSL